MNKAAERGYLDVVEFLDKNRNKIYTTDTMNNAVINRC